MNQKHPENRYWGSVERPQSKAEFFNAITTPNPAGEGSIATIRVYGPIDSWGGWWGVSAQDVSEVLDNLPETVTQIILRLNSPGGEVFEGISILNLLRAHRAQVLAVVDGRAASAASVIAAGCDETVMSPGTQMMIHSPWMFTYGNAAELRKKADVLDGIESSIIEIYTAKAGDKEWNQLLADETWLTAPEAVDLGLADRVGVIPDAGETSTAGADPDEDEDEDPFEETFDRDSRSFFAKVFSRSKHPRSSGPGEPNQKGDVVSYDSLKAGMRERLGVTDANASDEQLLDALTNQLNTAPADGIIETDLPDTAMIVDKAAFEELQSNAKAGVTALAQLDAQRRDSIVDAALRDGRINSAARDEWRAQLDVSEESTTKLLDMLPKNSVPVAEIGHNIETDAEDAQYASVYGETEKEA